MTIRLATADDLDQVRRLFREYEQELGIDLCFQSFDEELAGLPGKYAPPLGTLLIAERSQGCVAIRPMSPGVAELKRLYVRPEARGSGLGRNLCVSAIEFCRQAGYHAVRLDTLTRLLPARRLYESLGFELLDQPSEVATLEIIYFELTL